MAYTKKTWSTGETLTAAGMNNIENGVAANDTAISALNTTVESKLDKPEADGTNGQILSLGADGKLTYIDKHFMNIIKNYLNTAYRAKTKSVEISYFICELKQITKIIWGNININEGNELKMENKNEYEREIQKLLTEIDAKTKELNDEMNLWLEKSLEIRKFIYKADYLSDKQKQILSLRYLSFKTWEQIAVIMDLSYQWVHKLHERAFIKIAERM